MANETSEKITVNVNTMDLGYIDLLVSEGYYSTRTEFIKSAIKSQLEKHEDDKNRLLQKETQSGFELAVGIGSFTKKELEDLHARNSKKKYVFIGLCIIPSSIPFELMKETIEEIKVYGVCKGSAEVKEYYKL